MPYYNSNDGLYYEDPNCTILSSHTELGNIAAPPFSGIFMAIVSFILLLVIMTALAMPIFLLILLFLFRGIKEYNPIKTLILGTLLSYLAVIFDISRATRNLIPYTNELSSLLLLIGLYCVCYSLYDSKYNYSTKAKLGLSLLTLFILSVPIIDPICYQLAYWIMDCTSALSIISLELETSSIIREALTQLPYIMIFISMLFLSKLCSKSKKREALMILLFAVASATLLSVSFRYYNSITVVFNHYRIIYRAISMLILAYAASCFANGRTMKGCIYFAFYYGLFNLLIPFLNRR